MSAAPRIAVFPKAFMDPLCVDGSMTAEQWIDLAAELQVPGLEFYSGMLDLRDPRRWTFYRDYAAERGMSIPMLCCSPDFTHPDEAFRREQVAKQREWIDMTAALGGQYCRVLSGQRRPGVSIDDGVRWAAESIMDCHQYAVQHDVTLILENHYKDNYWKFPEFAQQMDVFCQLVDAIQPQQYPNFGVNYDPSNTILAGEDPLELLRRVKKRVVTMHASDRYLISGTLDDLRREELDSVGYAARLQHGEIGQGLNDYEAIFRELKSVDFSGWISIEDGVEGMEQLHRSVAFLNAKIQEHFA